jgi:hypothetical protein
MEYSERYGLTLLAMANAIVPTAVSSQLVGISHTARKYDTMSTISGMEIAHGLGE